MKVLVACEESQTVCSAFRKRGHEAYSCDIQECSGGHPEGHIQDDVLRILNGYKGCGYGCAWFTTNDGKNHETPEKWDLIIAHPPCTDLAVSGARWFKEKQKDGRQQKSINFFMQFVEADCEKIAIENPISIMSRIYRKPDQIVQPFWFGHPYRKSTCLWLKNLPLLETTDMVEPGEFDEYGFSKNFALRYAKDENGKIIAWNDPRTAKLRSKTPLGLATAMADKWG